MKILLFNEENVEKRFPHLCANFTWGAGGCSGHNGTASTDSRHTTDNKPLYKNNAGWWCAQKRHMASLTMLLEEYVMPQR